MTSSVVTLGTNAFTNQNSATFVDYLFGTVSGSSAFGTYTGNGSASGPTVSGLGFTPALVMIMKQTITTQNIWFVYGNNLNVQITIAYGSSGLSTSNLLTLSSGQFQVKTTSADFNTNSAVYTYAAWANTPPPVATGPDPLLLGSTF